MVALGNAMGGGEKEGLNNFLPLNLQSLTRTKFRKISSKLIGVPKAKPFIIPADNENSEYYG